MSLDETNEDTIKFMEKIRQKRIGSRRLYASDPKEDSVHPLAVATYTDNLLRELKKNEPTSDNRQFRINIITYELGDLARAIVYADRFRNDEKQFKIRMADAKLAISDVLTQLFLLCETNGWDFHEMRKLGAEHLEERHEDFKKQGWCELK